MELVAENPALRDTVEKLKWSEKQISADYRKINEMLLDLQAQSKSDNLIVSVSEQVGEGP